MEGSDDRAQRTLRQVGLGGQILSDLGIHKIRLLTNTPTHVPALQGFGIEIVEQVPVSIGRFGGRFFQKKIWCGGRCGELRVCGGVLRKSAFSAWCFCGEIVVECVVGVVVKPRGFGV